MLLVKLLEAISKVTDSGEAMDCQMPSKSRPAHAVTVLNLVLILLFCFVVANGQTGTNPKPSNATAGKQVTKSLHSGPAKSKEELDRAAAEERRRSMDTRISLV